METLEELKEKFNNLNKERSILYKKILELEEQETLKSFTVGSCYLDIWNNCFAKIIAINNDEFCFIRVDEYSIERDWSDIENIKNWKKITSEQFKDVYLTVIKDIQDPDYLEDKTESNWDVTLKSIVDSINKEK